MKTELVLHKRGEKRMQKEEIIEKAETALLQNIEILLSAQNQPSCQTYEARQNIETLIKVLQNYKSSF